MTGAYYYDEHVDQAVPLFVYSPTALNQVSRIRIENISVFGQASLKLTPWLTVTGGARYTHERKAQTSEAFFFNAASTFYTLGIDGLIDTPTNLRGVVTQTPTRYAREWNSFTPKIGLEAKLAPDTLLYASWAKGFKSGGFNSREASTSDFVAYDPETLQTYEVGLKTELLDRRLRLNLAGFYSRYNNLQLLVLRVSPDGSPQIATQNAAKARIYGIEGEIDFRPVRALALNAAIGYMDNKYLRLDPGAASVGVDLTDKLPQAPDWSIDLGAQYTIDTGGSSNLVYRVDYAYKSRFFFFAANNPLDVQRPYGLVNMRLTYDSGSAWTVAAYVTNLTDKFYSSQREDIRTAYDVALDWPAEPRVFGLEVGFKF